MTSQQRKVMVGVLLGGACSIVLLMLFSGDSDFRTFAFAFPRPASLHGGKATQTALDEMFPVLETAEDTFNSALHNNRVMRSLLDCLDTGRCGARQRDVVILASSDFFGAKRGRVSGENIWAQSVMDALDELGVSYLFAESIQLAVALHAMFPALVRAVMGGDMRACAADRACVKSPQHPLGIPVWKLWLWAFWPVIAAPDELPLDERWVLAPEDYDAGRRSGHVYLGYSVESSCVRRARFVPTAERAPAAWVLGKHKGYWQPPSYAWDGIDWTGPPNATDAAALPEGFKFVANANKFRTPDKELPLPPGIENTCPDDWSQLPVEEFYKRLANSRVLVGLGGPYTSPTAYDALCLGVPFLNPVTHWDARDPADRTKWAAQHDGLKYEDPPRVYNVLVSRDPSERGRQFWDAVLRAVNTPIDTYIPERMTRASVRRRVEEWLLHDWKADAEAPMAERRREGSTKLFML